MSNQILTLAVCARDISEQLVGLLKRLINVSVPQGWEIGEVILIINQSVSHVSQIERVLATEVSPGLRVVAEPELGIPFARNRALEEAIVGESDWLVFIDDDCVPEDNWLLELCNKAGESGAAVIAGGWSIAPSGAPSRWLPNSVWGEKGYGRFSGLTPDGAKLQTAYTRSVMFRIDDQSPVQLASLRFDVSRNRMGGSDVLFFEQYLRHEMEAVFARASKITEYYCGERLHLRWHILQMIRNGQFVLERDLSRGPVRILCDSAVALNKVVTDIGHLLVAAIRVRDVSLRPMLGALLLDLGRIFGAVILALGIRYQPYSDDWVVFGRYPLKPISRVSDLSESPTEKWNSPSLSPNARKQ